MLDGKSFTLVIDGDITCFAAIFASAVTSACVPDVGAYLELTGNVQLLMVAG